MTRFGDRYGYYQIGDIKTYSRYELMDIHHNKPQSWQWNYNDEFFSRYDWSIEPTQSIDELYKKRAEQLRQEYDYLIFYYSGGHDSANMLSAFLDNNIHLDEICVFYSKFDNISNQYKELSSLTWTKLNDLKKQYPKLKIRKFEYGEHILKWHEYIKELGYENNLPDMFGMFFPVNRLILDLAHLYVDDWKTLLKNKKKLAWILGVDKPQLRYCNQQWIFNFHDGVTQMQITPMRQLIDDGTIGTYEFFYWAPSKECVDILIKQCHLLKNKYKKQAEIDFSKIIGVKNFVPGYGWEIDKMDDEFIKTIYPKNFKFKEEFFKIKTPFYIWGNRDEWFFKSKYKGAAIHRDMYHSICKKSHYRSWYNNETTLDYGFRNAMSRDYII
jgi:hypothetical protein